LALGTADVIIVIGSRLDIRQTGADVEGFRKGKKIFHIDCDEGEINNRVVECVSIVVDAGEFLDHAAREFASAQFAKRKEWLEEIQGLRERWPDIQEIHGIPGINPNSFMHALSQQSMGASGYCVDVGNHQMWAAQSLELQPNQFFMTSGGMGSMGFALPAAIGASFADDMKPVVVIAGDGGFQLNIQELQTVVRTKLPLKMVVINNNTLGMIRQFQDSYFEGRHQSTSWGYSAPDFAEVAKAFGIEALTISTTEEIEKALRWMWRTPDSPSLLQVMIDMQANAYPKIAFGKPITEMEPFAKPLDMEGT
jgi:acetolactate synthase-1/2/3 large subunit